MLFFAMYYIYFSESLCKNGYQDFIHSNRYCFKVLQKKSTWEEARKTCEKDVGDLNTNVNVSKPIVLANKYISEFWFGSRIKLDNKITRK